MYRSPGNHVRGSPYGKQLPEGPIHDFATVIEKTSPEDWQKRTQAFVSLVSLIPASVEEYGAEEAWFNSPTILRHLAWPLSELLKDARSTVVKRTCQACTELFQKCQSDARYLLKDIMPTIMGVHGQTVAVIRAAVQEMVLGALALTPCKMAMPLWLDRLKSDKSRTVREACSLYLGVGLSEWTDHGYLSTQIWDQVGTALVKALRDPSPGVRQNSKKGLEVIFQQQSEVLNRLVNNPDLMRDVRVRKLMQRIQAGETVGDDISVASSRVGSVASRGHYRSGGSVTGGRAIGGSPSYLSRGSSSRSRGIPTTIGVTTPVPASKSKGATRKQGGLGPPVRMQGSVTSSSRIQTAPSGSPSNGSTELYPDPSVGYNANSTSFDTADSNDSELPVIASADALREFAKSRGGSRRSSLLQERFARSMAAHPPSTTVETIPETIPEPATTTTTTSESTETAAPTSNGESAEVDLDDILAKEAPKAPSKDDAGVPPTSSDLSNSVTQPEHTRIAHELLEAHKKHIDQVMETLKVEMDALKEFEVILVEGAPQRPTEDEVLEYFESVGLCVEQRAKAGSILQKKMDKISRGAT